MSPGEEFCFWEEGKEMVVRGVVPLAQELALSDYIHDRKLTNEKIRELFRIFRINSPHLGVHPGEKLGSLDHAI